MTPIAMATVKRFAMKTSAYATRIGPLKRAALAYQVSSYLTLHFFSENYLELLEAINFFSFFFFFYSHKYIIYYRYYWFCMC